MTSLRELGCDLGQGFLFARPMNHEALVEYLVRGEEVTGEPRSHAA
jgi:EAL domain-containing protein (putative c-di-GMP-specific phosphodiesterase class I)